MFGDLLSCCRTYRSRRGLRRTSKERESDNSGSNSVLHVHSMPINFNQYCDHDRKAKAKMSLLWKETVGEYL